MNEHSIILLGGPDSGKTNYLSRLWLSLNSKKGRLIAPGNPRNIKYVEGGAEHLLSGVFAPRSDTNSLHADLMFEIPVRLAAGPTDSEVVISVPDVSGELWKQAVQHGDIAPEWMSALEDASGALLFVRVLSSANPAPLDWVNAAEFLSWADGDDEGRGEEHLQVPAQVALCELLRFLDEKLDRLDGQRPRVAILITAWDLVDGERQANGPKAYLKQEFPLFAGRLADCDSLDVRVFGVSVVGGDFEDPDFKTEFQEGDVAEMGYVTIDTDTGTQKIVDVTLPVAWVVEPLFDD